MERNRGKIGGSRWHRGSEKQDGGSTSTSGSSRHGPFPQIVSTRSGQDRDNAGKRAEAILKRVRT
jgi:hypothetical protein